MTRSKKQATQNFSDRFVIVTYLIYVILWEGLIIGGCSYVVFGLGHSGWWFALAFILSGAAYTPEKWRCLLNGSQTTQ